MKDLFDSLTDPQIGVLIFMGGMVSMFVMIGLLEVFVA